VEEAGAVVVPHANHAGTISSSFDLEVGDLVIFMEDLLATGNVHLPGKNSDFDYQDAIVILRSDALPGTEIPEPASMLLLGIGAGGALLRKRKVSAI